MIFRKSSRKIIEKNLDKKEQMTQSTENKGISFFLGIPD